jgi:hypothetical protein
MANRFWSVRINGIWAKSKVRAPDEATAKERAKKKFHAPHDVIEVFAKGDPQTNFAELGKGDKKARKKMPKRMRHTAIAHVKPEEVDTSRPVILILEAEFEMGDSNTLAEVLDHCEEIVGKTKELGSVRKASINVGGTFDIK